MDATNPIADAPPENGVLKFFTTLDESQMERLKKEFPRARFVKAFNSVGHAFMVDPKFPGGRPTIFICGEDEKARRTIGRILDPLPSNRCACGGASRVCCATSGRTTSSYSGSAESGATAPGG